MGFDNYWKARSYAFKLNADVYRDLVHDAYIVWWNKTQRNLFDEHPGIVIKTVKNIFFDYLKRKVWFYNKENQGSRKFDEFDDHTFNSITPEDEYIAKEILQEYMQLVEKTPKDRAVFTGRENTTKDILTKRLNGYTNKEIAEELGVTKALVTYYVQRTDLKKFENKYRMSHNNPFNGSKTIVKKHISEAVWERRTDHSEFELEAENEWVQLYKHKESKEGWLVKIKNPAQSEVYVKSFVDSNIGKENYKKFPEELEK